MSFFLQKLETRFKEAPAESATLQDLVKNELASKKHVATEGLLWLTRYVLLLHLKNGLDRPPF